MNSQSIRSPALALGLAALASAGAALLSGCGVSSAESRKTTRLEQGRHLVEEVGMCIDCHSPRHPDGQFDRSRWLQGAPLGFKSIFDMPWAEVAPPLAGLSGFTDAQAVEFLMTGVRPNKIPVRPPMPEYRLTRDEAEAVVAYLRSLGGKASP